MQGNIFFFNAIELNQIQKKNNYKKWMKAFTESPGRKFTTPKISRYESYTRYLCNNLWKKRSRMWKKSSESVKRMRGERRKGEIVIYAPQQQQNEKNID